MKFTAEDIVKAINQLPKDKFYNYINPETTTKIIIKDVQLPEGPIIIKRYDPNKKQGIDAAKKTSISSQMIWRIANSISPGNPINFDRVLGGSYNTRSALEVLMAHTPEFYFCYPGRIEIKRARPVIKRGHKHLVWRPDSPHEKSILKKIDTDKVISEIPTVDAIYDSLTLPENFQEFEMDINVQRRHAQIQIALLKIGLQLGSRVWIAQNDKSIKYNGTKIGEMKGAIPSLQNVSLLTSFEKAIKAALMIDVIWFRNETLMPAVFEIEHSTTITSGLSRMKGLQDEMPKLKDTRWVIVAADEDRQKILKAASKRQFYSLEPNYFPYSSVEELYSLCQRRNLRGVNDEFLDCFMEKCLK